MAYLQLLTQTHSLPIQTAESPQQVVFLSKSKLFLTFSTYWQTWDLSNDTLITQSLKNETIYFWTNPIPINNTTVVFVNLYECRQLATLDTETQKYTPLHIFSEKNTNYDEIFYNKADDEIIVVQRGQSNNLFWFKNSEVKMQSFQEHMNVFKFDEQGTLALSGIQYSEHKKNIFNLVGHSNSVEHEIKDVNEIEQINCIQRYDDNKAILGLIYKQKVTSSVLIFNLNQNINLQIFTINFPLDKLVLSQSGWVAMCTTQQHSSTLQIQSCFKGEQKEKQINFQECISIPEQFRIWGDEYVIATVSNPQDDKMLSISTVRLGAKKEIYMKMMESSKIDLNFESEIYKSVIDNLV